jgi:glycosyltransferase involved in cell wall biosynthesis
MHASYEDKPGVPDRAFTQLDDAAFERQVRSWTRFLACHSVTPPTVVHLHHLTPMHEAVHQLWPHVPVITHLHGTELKMLAASDGTVIERQWTERMRVWAHRSARVVTVSATDHQLALDLLSLPPQRVVTIANGVDTDVFVARAMTVAERLERWQRWLVDDPRGWRPGEGEGSVRYSDDDLSAFLDADGAPVPVVLYAGRFLRFKRLQLLIEAHHRMRQSTGSPAVLVIVGGYPGEWEDEHPYDTVQRLGAEGVFFLGWRDHGDLAEALACSDVFAAPSVDEPFGLVYLEAMAAGLPPIATTTGGPLSFINVDPGRPTGWMVPPDDVVALAHALGEAVSEPLTRAARGRRAARFVRERYSWASAAAEFALLYGAVVAEPETSGRAQLGRLTSGVA